MRFEELSVAVREGDRDRAAREAHKIRGNGGMYGYPELSEIAGLIEDASREEQDVSLLDELLDELELTIKRIQNGIAARTESTIHLSSNGSLLD